MSLEGEAETMVTGAGTPCSVCSFISSQPTEPGNGYTQDDWDAFLAGPTKSASVFRVLRNHGYPQRTDGPVNNHRNNGHRR